MPERNQSHSSNRGDRMSQKPTEKDLIDQRLVRALGHPLRVRILDLLTEEVLSPNQLTKLLDASLSHISYHVRVLEQTDAVELVDQKKRRGAVEHFFRATADSFLGSPRWRRVPKIFLGAVAGASLQSFINKSVRALRAGKLDGRDSAFVWMSIVVDEKGREEVAAVRESATDELLSIHANSQQRLARAGLTGLQYIVGVAGFEAAGSS